MDKYDLIISLKALMLDIFGVEIYSINSDEELRNRKTFDQGSMEILKELLYEKFNLEVDLSTLESLTLEVIADRIEKSQQHRGCPVVNDEPEETETFDLGLPILNLVMN